MKHILPAFRIFLFLSIVTGLVYPILMTALGHGLFRNQVDGQMIKKAGVLIGAKPIGQKFTAEKYFWGRPSSVDYNPIPSGGSNLGPTSEVLKKAVNDRAAIIRKNMGLSETDAIPQDLLFASGSGLDPDISPEAAEFQSVRIARVRGIDVAQVQKIIEAHVVPPDLGFLGDPRVNVLELNLALDEGLHE